MALDDDHNKNLEQIVDLDDHLFSIAEIDAMIKSQDVFEHFFKMDGQNFYSKILQSLTYERYDEDEACTLWHEILRHLAHLNQCLGRDVGIAVASMDYLSNIKAKLTDPKIIEEDKIEYVAESSTKDELTTLYVRDVFDIMLKKELDESLRSKQPMCLLLIDIDDFKQVNDQHGHLMGDKVLKNIGLLINQSVREMDLAARYGGEELAVIMPRIKQSEAIKVAQRIRQDIESLVIDQLSVTVSIGVAQSIDNNISADELIAAADQALYQAKRKGKNQVVTSTACH